MDIHKIIFAVDDNPMYLGFWKFISKWTKERLGVTPVLFHITEFDSEFYEDEYGLIKKFKALPNFTTSLQCRMVRMWGTRFFMNEYCMMGDIDMMMVDKEYFFRNLDEYPEESLVIYSSDAYDKRRPECINEYAQDRYPICYNLAKGQVYDKLLDTKREFTDYLNEASSHGFLTDHIDELYYGMKVNQTNHGINVIKLNRGFTSFFNCPNRFERPVFLNSNQQQELKQNKIIDIHLMRPFEMFEVQINIIKELIYEK
jgi:hypothetical protein